MMLPLPRMQIQQQMITIVHKFRIVRNLKQKKKKTSMKPKSYLNARERGLQGTYGDH